MSMNVFADQTNLFKQNGWQDIMKYYSIYKFTDGSLQ